MKVTMGQVDRPSNGSLGPVPAPTLIRSTGLYQTSFIGARFEAFKHFMYAFFFVRTEAFVTTINSNIPVNTAENCRP